MGKTLLINGSPRAPRSNSKRYAALFDTCCPVETDYYNLNKNNHQTLIDAMATYTDVVFIFPLYADGIPVTLLHFLKALEAQPPEIKPVVSVLINCGFLEYEQNDIAVRMMQLFCAQNGYDFGSVLRIGSGEAILDTPFKFVVTRAMKRFAASIVDWQYGSYQAKMPLPKPLFIHASTQYWEAYGRKNGLTKKDMQTMTIEGRS